MGETVRYEDRGAAAWLTIDREERRNALSPEVIRELIDALAHATQDDAVRVVVVTGAGEKAFCAGGDIGGFGGVARPGELPTRPRSASEPPEGEGFAGDESVETAPAAIGRLLDLIWHHPKPTIARVNGRALGGGFGLMLACDVAIAADDVEVGMPEIDLGLWPHVITAVVQRRVPRNVALELMLTARRVSAEEAVRWGMVNRIVPRTELDSAVDELVATIAAKPPAIVRLGKRSFLGAEDRKFGDALAHLKERLAENLEAPDLAEGVGAFLQKRPPEWTSG